MKHAMNMRQSSGGSSPNRKGASKQLGIAGRCSGRCSARWISATSQKQVDTVQNLKSPTDSQIQEVGDRNHANGVLAVKSFMLLHDDLCCNFRGQQSLETFLALDLLLCTFAGRGSGRSDIEPLAAHMSYVFSQNGASEPNLFCGFNHPWQMKMKYQMQTL